jgi:hypothetical protein
VRGQWPRTFSEATLLLSYHKKDHLPFSCHRQGRWSLTKK